MSTRATIRFSDSDDEYFVYRGHDGYPNNILSDLEEVIKKSNGRWSGSEIGCLVTLFLAMGYDYNTKRLPYYELTTSFHGDESYRYWVTWNDNLEKWEYGVTQ
jgi:hypothetical protein